jgi:nucleotidyltransferase/DNA polymerase involved in DNA repair
MMHAVSRAPDVAPRIAALVIPDFLIEVSLRVYPSLVGRPVAVADGLSRREIVAMNRAARGVAMGMTPKQARAACPGLVVIARDERSEREAMAELLDALESCSPAVEAIRPGTCCFDVRALPGGETRALGAAVALASALGLQASAAVADDKFSAQCAALAGGGCSVVTPGGSAAFLAPLPVSLLPLAPGDAERFELLGLRVLGQIAALPAAPLAARFGERARAYTVLARGEDREPLRPRRAATIYEERFAFDASVDRLEPLFFAMRGCIAGVAERLSAAAQTTDRVDLVLVLDATNSMAPSPSVLDIRVDLAQPTASGTIMFELARVALEAREQLGLVEAIIVRSAPCGEPPPQLGLFDGSSGSRHTALAAAIARLNAALAPDEVVTLTSHPERSRLPERMQSCIPITSPRQLEHTCRSLSRARSASPERKRTTVPAMREGQPVWAPALRLLDPPRPMRAPAGETERAGPFRLSEGWWERPVERDYYQMADRSGALVLAFFDVREGGWYVHGVFD